MSDMTIIMPYYESPNMLREHVRVWNGYRSYARHNVKIIIVDDGSPKHHAAPIMKQCRLQCEVYRFLDDKPWNMHAARNLGATMADTKWVLMTDMDMVLTAHNVDWLIGSFFDKSKYYRFTRKYINNQIGKQHRNSFLISTSAWREFGGYDERYCGVSRDGEVDLFKRLDKALTPSEFEYVNLLNYRQSEIQDAAGNEHPSWPDRKQCQINGARILAENKPATMEDLTWERTL